MTNEITPTFGREGRGAQYVNGKLGIDRPGGHHRLLHWIGTYTLQGQEWDAWVGEGITGGVYVRLDQPGKRPKFIYDPSGALRRTIEQQNRI